jgi:hypothetical protein
MSGSGNSQDAIGGQLYMCLSARALPLDAVCDLPSSKARPCSRICVASESVEL